MGRFGQYTNLLTCAGAWIDLGDGIDGMVVERESSEHGDLSLIAKGNHS